MEFLPFTTRLEKKSILIWYHFCQQRQLNNGVIFGLTETQCVGNYDQSAAKDNFEGKAKPKVSYLKH